VIRAVLLAARLVVGGAFLFAAATKLPDLSAFAVDMANFRLLPAAAVPFLAPALVGVEVLVALALLAGVWVRAAALLAALLLVLFAGGLAQALLRGIDLACGCFGGSERATWGSVIRDLLLLLPAVVLLRAPGGAAAHASPGAPTSA
jgi:hypothetical protein